MVAESSHAGDACAVGRTVETAAGTEVLVVAVAVAVATADGLAVLVFTLAGVVAVADESPAAGACAVPEPFELQPVTTTADAAKSTNPTILLTATAIPLREVPLSIDMTRDSITGCQL
jgi:hypothetical protein